MVSSRSGEVERSATGAPISNAFGWAMGYAADERPERALNECAACNGSDCKIVTRFCSGTTG